MSIKVRFSNGVFEPLEQVRDFVSGNVYRVFSEEELRSLAENLEWLKAAERSFDFWNNEEDSVYDPL